MSAREQQADIVMLLQATCEKLDEIAVEMNVLKRQIGELRLIVFEVDAAAEAKKAAEAVEDDVEENDETPETKTIPFPDVDNTPR
jgi:septal ring factor EnvC (AmiA/AmiB activator)